MMMKSQEPTQEELTPKPPSQDALICEDGGEEAMMTQSKELTQEELARFLINFAQRQP
jgi:hypothetical protein